MDYTKITILGHEFHDDDWSMMFCHYYYMCCATITTFIMDTLHSIWSIEFSKIIRDATNKLHDVDIDIFVGSVDFFVGSMLIYGCISVFVRFIVGLLGSIATVNKDQTESKKDATKNTMDSIESTEADEIGPSLPSLPTGAVSTDTAPPTLVPEPTGPHTTIKQLRDIRSLLAKLESKVNELESLLAGESSTSSANNNDDSTTDDSTTDDSASNERPTVFADRGYDREEADESNERNDEQEPPTMAQAKANALLWQRNQVAKMKRQSRQRREEKRGY